MQIGESYYIRTSTYHYLGRVTAVTALEVTLRDAAWVASQGRMFNSLVDGTLDEVEPYPDPVVVNRQHVVDYTAWRHALPREQA